MTKVSVFGQQPTETKELKKIEFVSFLSCDEKIEKAESTELPRIWDNVQLFDYNYSKNLDAILAWDDNMESKCIFLGHWNDGVV